MGDSPKGQVWGVWETTSPWETTAIPTQPLRPLSRWYVVPWSSNPDGWLAQTIHLRLTSKKRAYLIRPSKIKMQVFLNPPMTIKALCLGRAMVGLEDVMSWGFLSSNHVDAAECGGIGLLDHVFQRCQLNDQPLGEHKKKKVAKESFLCKAS